MRIHRVAKLAVNATLVVFVLAVGVADSWAQSRALRPIRVAERRALLIGNAAYEHTRPLANTIADVRELDATLRELGFRTFRKENLTIDEMDEAVSAFAAELRADDMAFFYFSGHGVQVDARNYLLPIDFQQGGLSTVRRRAIDVDSVREAIEQASRVRVLVLDACRNNPFGEGKGDIVGLAKMNVDAEGTLVAYATGASNVASDNPNGRLGLYMTHLVDELRRETVELGDVFDRTQQRVYAASRQQQDPEIYDKVIGKLYLRGGPSPNSQPEARVAVVEPSPTPQLTAAEAWVELEGTESEADLERFIAAYGGQKGGASTWVALAEARLRELPELFAAREAQEFKQEWRIALEAIKRSGSVAAAKAFISHYGRDPSALVAVANEYLAGEGLTRDPDAAADLYQQAAEVGDPVGMTSLGQMYARGDSVSEDQVAARSWYRQAADRGYAPAEALLGEMFEKGLGGEQSFAEAANWYRKAADQGHPLGQALLGWLYATGDGVRQDLSEALDLCQSAADNDSAEGQTFLGRLYENGLGVERDFDVAAQWYRRAADRGFATGQAQLGRMYQFGLGVEQDHGEALEWFGMAARQGSALGQTLLGSMYEKGLGADRDTGKALEWYRKAADQGDPEGSFLLGDMFYRGYGGTGRDYGNAMKHFTAAASQGHGEARFRLGTMFWNGEGVKKNKRKAREWYRDAVEAYREAAERGDIEAQLELGRMYDEGFGVEKNLRTAASWYRMAADQGFPDAQWLMGDRYMSAKGVRKDPVTAAKFFRLAADQEFAKAQFSLGEIYRNGAGLKKDRREAAQWYRLAARQGHADAKRALRGMGETE